MRTMKTAKKPVAKFKKGDKVRVVDTLLTEFIGTEFVVRRVFWLNAEGGQSAGWVVESDAMLDSTQRRCWFEMYLQAA